MIDLSGYGVWLTESGTLIHEVLVDLKDEQIPIYFIRNYDYMTHTWNLITLNTSKNKAVSADMFNFTLSHSKSVYHVNEFCFDDINKAKEVLQMYIYDKSSRPYCLNLKSKIPNLVVGANIAGIDDIWYELSNNGCIIFKLDKMREVQLRMLSGHSIVNFSTHHNYTLARPSTNEWVFVKSGDIESLRDYARKE